MRYHPSSGAHAGVLRAPTDSAGPSLQPVCNPSATEPSVTGWCWAVLGGSGRYKGRAVLAQATRPCCLWVSDQPLPTGEGRTGDHASGDRPKKGRPPCVLRGLVQLDAPPRGSARGRQKSLSSAAAPHVLAVRGPVCPIPEWSWSSVDGARRRLCEDHVVVDGVADVLERLQPILAHGTHVVALA